MATLMCYWYLSCVECSTVLICARDVGALMHVGFNCRVQCGLSGSGAGLGMGSGTASRQVVCMVVYRTWCGCRETVSHITCWLPFVLCVLDLIVVACASCFVYLQ